MFVRMDDSSRNSEESSAYLSKPYRSRYTRNGRLATMVGSESAFRGFDSFTRPLLVNLESDDSEIQGYRSLSGI
jgi:hypothetical protein